MPKIGGGGSKGAGGGSYSGAVKIPNLFGKGRSATTIPHETASGQLAMFSPSQIMTSGMKMRGVLRPGPGKRGRVTTSTPPFKVSPTSGGRVAGGDPRAQVTALARREELAAKTVKDRNTRAKMARGEATRQTYRNREQNKLQKATEPYDVPKGYGPNTRGK